RPGRRVHCRETTAGGKGAVRDRHARRAVGGKRRVVGDLRRGGGRDGDIAERDDAQVELLVARTGRGVDLPQAGEGIRRLGNEDAIGRLPRRRRILRRRRDGKRGGRRQQQDTGRGSAGA